jgi:DNA mismatch endonuclease (patch repair protein)
MDKVSSEVRSRIMSKIRSNNSVPELTLRRILWSLGIRFRKFYGVEKIDIAVPKEKIAVFVDGCFWHSCQLHGHVPRSNTGYWEKKLAKNKDLAASKDLRLKEAEWEIIHFWEHEIYESPTKCALKIYEIINMKKGNR